MLTAFCVYAIPLGIGVFAELFQLAGDGCPAAVGGAEPLAIHERKRSFSPHLENRSSGISLCLYIHESIMEIIQNADITTS